MIGRRIKFRHVQSFVEICREGSFKLAAEKLFLTQPAISKTLKELEDILGHTLLVRDRGGVRLTADGEIFLRFAEMSIAALQQGIDGMAQRQNAGQPTVSVGVLPSVAARLVPAVAERFGRAMPEAVLKIADGPLGFLLERLKLGVLDLVIGRMGAHEQMKGTSFSALYQERVSFIVRAGHPLLDEPKLSRIGEWPVIYPVEGSAIRPIVDRFMAEQGIGEVPRRIETVSGAFGRVHAQNSDAIWIISEGVVASEIAQGQLAALPFNTNTTLGPIGITAREDWEFTPAAQRFRRILRETVDTVPGITV
ncbi:MAG: pca operon transcription factor PcaQ [Pseudomonadota bacterium]